MATAAEKKAAQAEAEKAAQAEAEKAAQAEAEKAAQAEAEKAAQAEAEKAAPEQESVTLKFNGPYKAWANGDIASFSNDKAAAILALVPSPAELYEKE